jgi:NADPH-dependent curcumin reductase CurA
MFDLCVDALADRGTLIVIGMMSAYASGWARRAHSGLPEKLLWKAARVCGFFLLRYAPLWAPHLRALANLQRAGRLVAAVDGERFVGLESAAAAVARLQSGASAGKVVLQVARELPDGDEGAAAAAAYARL